MQKLDLLYDYREKCLVCAKEYTIKKVRKSRIKIEKQDEDFCNYYGDINPYFYDYLICQHCNTVYFHSFKQYLKKDDVSTRSRIKSFYGKMKGTSDLKGKRTLEDALRLGKLSIITGNMIGVSLKVTSGLYMRVAWFNRYKKDTIEERKYLNLAYDSYLKNYEYGAKDMTDEMCCYLLGEISYRLGNIDDSRLWFSKLFTLHRDIGIINKGRDRWLSIKNTIK